MSKATARVPCLLLPVPTPCFCLWWLGLVWKSLVSVLFPFSLPGAVLSFGHDHIYVSLRMGILPGCMLHSMDGVSLFIIHLGLPSTCYVALVDVNLSQMAVTSKTILVQVLQGQSSRAPSINFLTNHVLSSSLITSGSILWVAFFFILPCGRQSSASQHDTPLTLPTLPRLRLVTQGLHLPHGFPGIQLPVQIDSHTLDLPQPPASLVDTPILLWYSGPAWPGSPRCGVAHSEWTRRHHCCLVGNPATARCPLPCSTAPSGPFA